MFKNKKFLLFLGILLIIIVAAYFMVPSVKTTVNQVLPTSSASAQPSWGVAPIKTLSAAGKLALQVTTGAIPSGTSQVQIQSSVYGNKTLPVYYVYSGSGVQNWYLNTPWIEEDPNLRYKI
jgi:uncharacterized protein (UPF0333 family)